MKSKGRVLMAFALVAFLMLGQTAIAITIDFESLTGPSVFASAVPSPQTLDFSTSDGNVEFQGGVILTNTSALPANQTSLYGTAYFGTKLSNPLTVTFANPVSNFFLDVYNGLTTDITYLVSDNVGNSASFTLAPNLNGGTTQIGFAATGTIITIASISEPISAWDFFIDNVTFNEELPPEISPVPEPSTMILLGAGLVGLAGYGKKKFRR